MTKKEKIWYLMKEYYIGNYSTDIFCDEIVRIFCCEKDQSLSDLENNILKSSIDIFARYSPYKDDIKSGYLFDESRIRKEFENLMLKLNQNQGNHIP